MTIPSPVMDSFPCYPCDQYYSLHSPALSEPVDGYMPVCLSCYREMTAAEQLCSLHLGMMDEVLRDLDRSRVELWKILWSAKQSKNSEEVQS